MLSQGCVRGKQNCPKATIHVRGTDAIGEQHFVFLLQNSTSFEQVANDPGKLCSVATVSQYNCLGSGSLVGCLTPKLSRMLEGTIFSALARIANK